MEPEPHELTLSVLQHRCTHELNSYQPGRVGDDRFCLEIFKRAINDNDHEAWMVLQEQFRAHVLHWFRCHARRHEALQIENEQSYADDTFARLWQWSHNRGKEHEFRSLAGALKFLHLCLNSSIIDHLRSFTHKEHVELQEYGVVSVSPMEEERYDRRALWDAVKKLLPDRREQLVIFMMYYEGFKPGEISERCPNDFKDTKEVYHSLRLAMGRLRRHADILRKKISYDE